MFRLIDNMQTEGIYRDCNFDSFISQRFKCCYDAMLPIILLHVPFSLLVFFTALYSLQLS